MPIYEYECQKGHVEERLFFREGSPVYLSCGLCGGESRRIMSAPSPPRMNCLGDKHNPPEVKKEWDNRFGRMYSMDFGKAEKDKLYDKAEMQGIYE